MNTKTDRISFDLLTEDAERVLALLVRAPGKTDRDLELVRSLQGEMRTYETSRESKLRDRLDSDLVKLASVAKKLRSDDAAIIRRAVESLDAAFRSEVHYRAPLGDEVADVAREATPTRIANAAEYVDRLADEISNLAVALSPKSKNRDLIFWQVESFEFTLSEWRKETELRGS